MRSGILSALILALSPIVASVASAQAEAKLYARTTADEVRVVLEVEIEGGWHLYHKELGHPKAVGKPTRVTPAGAGIEWSEVRFPEPEEFDQSDFGEGVFILGYEDTVYFYAAGRLSEGAAVDGLTVKIDGLTCEDGGMCIPFKKTLSPTGKGPDEVWDEYPANLSAPVALPSADRIQSGEADASLYLRIEEGVARAAIEIEIERGWHLYHSEKGNDLGIGKPTRIQFQGKGVTWGTPVWPEPEEIDQSDIIDGAWIWGHEGKIVIYAKGVVDPGLKGEALEGLARRLWVDIDGQTCAEACIPYRETAVSRGPGADGVWADFPEPAKEGSAPQPSGAGEAGGASSASTGARGAGGAGGSLAAEGSRGIAAELSKAPDPSALSAGDSDEPADEPADEEEETPLGGFLAQAVLWGLITLLMPCTYPMIPITISFFTKQAEARGGRVLPLSLTYGAGIVIIFVLIGVVVGQVIVPFAQNPWTNLIIGLLFFYFALVLFGVVNLQPPRFLLNVAGKASMKGGFVGVFLMGATLVVTSFTCTAPFVGTLLAQGAAGGDLVRVILGMSVFGLTMAIPFVVLSLLPSRLRSIPKSGAWMNTIKVTLGFVELAAAFKFFSNSDLGWDWNVISREFFLALWAVIFGVAALFLFGVVGKHGKGTIGWGRRGSGVLFAAFAVYCGWGMTGKKMDYLMSSIAPPYSGGELFPMLYEFGGDWAIRKDDFPAARELALAEGKLIFVNFTGFT